VIPHFELSAINSNSPIVSKSVRTRKFIKPAIFVDYVPVNKPGDLFPFFLDPTTYTTNAEFKAYWDTKLSDPANAPWAPIMSDIIHGNLPMFFLAVQTDGQYHLIDGLQFFLFIFGGYGQPFNPLRLNGDYPLGTYVFMADDSFYGNELLTGSTMAITIR